MLLFDTPPGLFIGMAVPLLLFLYRASRPHVALLGRDPGADGRWSDLERLPGNARVAGVVVLRPETARFFANADAVRDAIRAHAVEGTKAVVLDAETVPAIDVTAVGMLVELADELGATESSSSSPRTSAKFATSFSSARRMFRCGPIRRCRLRATPWAMSRRLGSRHG